MYVAEGPLTTGLQASAVTWNTSSDLKKTNWNSKWIQVNTYFYCSLLTRKKKKNHRLREKTYGCQGGRIGKGIVRDFGMDMSTFLCFKWITNKDLLFSTWYSVQCHVQCQDRRRVWGRMDTCICMAKSLHCSPETVITLLIGYIPRQNKNLKRKKKIIIFKNANTPRVVLLHYLVSHSVSPLALNLESTQ